jgi:allantoinase
MLVRHGRFIRFEEPGCARDPNVIEVDLGGRLVLPGVVDAHVHFDDPGYTWRETFATGTLAAAAGGVTCVADMPCTSVPPVVHASNFLKKHSAVRDKAHVDFLFWGGMCANIMEGGTDWRWSLKGLSMQGVCAIKCYLHSGMDSFRSVSLDQLRELALACRELGLPLGVHAEDHDLVTRLEAELRGAGLDGPDAYVDSRPAEAEIRAVEMVIQAARETGAHLHVVHLGSGKALDLLEDAQSQGVSVSVETCPHYLEFTREDFRELGSRLKTAPPVKEESDRTRLWQGVREGGIAYLATDHAAGMWPDEKRTGSFWTDYGGIPGVELLLPWAYTRGVAEGRLTLERLVDLLCAAPARFLGVDQAKGGLLPGLDADFVVLEDEEWTVVADGLHNLNRYTPLEGRRLAVRVHQTWLRGDPVWDASDARVAAGPCRGRLVRRVRTAHG